MHHNTTKSIPRFRVVIILIMIGVVTWLAERTSAVEQETAPLRSGAVVTQDSGREAGAYDPAGRKVNGVEVPAAEWVIGDVFVANGNNSGSWSYKVFSNNGTFKEQLYGGMTNTRHTGCAFDASYNLYTTAIDVDKIVKYSGTGNHNIAQVIDTAGPTGVRGPESIVFDGSGQFYVGNSSISGGIPGLQRYNPAGVLQQTYFPTYDWEGVDWIDLAPDGQTIYYTSEGTRIQRYSVAGGGNQLSEFAYVGGTNTALRRQPGTGDIFVANYSSVKRYYPSGSMRQTYTLPNSSWLFAANLDPNGTSFWTGDLNTGKFWRINIASGQIEIGPIDSGSTSIAGICVKGEITSIPPASTSTPSSGTPNPTSTRSPVPPTGTQPPNPTSTRSPVPPTGTRSPIPPNSTPTHVPSGCTVEFWDVPSSNPFYSNVRCLACRGILSGYSDGSFRPGNNITRGQIAKVVSNAAGFNDNVSGRWTYTDVPSSYTFWVWIERLSLRGVMGGYSCGNVGEPCDGLYRPYFRPSQNATRGQLSKIVSNAAGFTESVSGQTYTDVPNFHPFYREIMRLSNRSVMSGYFCGGPGEPCDNMWRPYFRPGANVTRGQASKIVANTFFPQCQTP